MANLEKAVNKEMESISERIHALTEKQHEEFMDAKQEGKYIAPPLTDEQLAAQEEARIAGNADEEESSEEARALMVEEGLEVVDLTLEQKEVFRESCSSVWETAKSDIGEDRYNAVIDECERIEAELGIQ